jgi:protein farnesyltransferase subunit beta
MESKAQMRRTDRDQENTELSVLKFFEEVGFSTKSSEEYEGEAKYFRLLHYNFAKKLMMEMPNGYTTLDAGFPWLVYWITNIISMSKDNYEINHDNKMQLVQILKELQHEDGGFCGNPKGYAHLISTYAAVMAIVNLDMPEAYDIINIPKMKNFLLKMKNNEFDIDKAPSYTDKNGVYLITRDKDNDFISYHTAYPGTFQNHINGESDLRSTYCAMVIASTLNLINWDDLDNDPLTKGVVENIKNCQTFEGGLGPEPFCEAHGGYSYCGIATLVLLKKLNEIDTNSFLRWLVNRQMIKEGGFNGRTNKLVDSCYSFWQGSIFNMIYMGNNKFTYDMELLYDQLSLQAYILFACQNTKVGGLQDKPGKYPDLFHTNYATAGLILSQKCLVDNYKVVLNSDLENVFEILNPIYCVPQTKIEKALKYYSENKK